MLLKTKLITILTVFNLLASAGIGWWVYNKNNHVLNVNDLECLLEDLAHSNPQFLVSLLNNSANNNEKNDTQILEKVIFKKRLELLKSGFSIKKQHTDPQKTLVIFSDLTCPHCITFLKNVDAALLNLNCAVIIIPISMLGEKATYQAKLITAASLQDSKKAFKLALLYKPLEGDENNMLGEAGKLGLDLIKLSQEIESKPVTDSVIQQTKIAEDSFLPGVPSIFLITFYQAYFIPPVEAKDLPNLIENPAQGRIK